MADNSLGGIFNRVKEVTKQAADATARQAKLARLRLNLMSLHTERSRHLQNIGSSIFAFYKQGKKFDQSFLFAELKDEIPAIEELDRQTEAIETQIQATEQDNIEVTDITPQ